MSNKLLYKDLVLKSRVKNIDVLCFTEHWIKEDYLTSFQLDQYKLVSNFGRRKYNNGGSCVYVKKNICTKDINCLQGISIEKDFEIAISEVVTYGYVIACIYTSPNGDFRVFLNLLYKKYSLIRKRSSCYVETRTYTFR
jgi:hypothetical protein